MTLLEIIQSRYPDAKETDFEIMQDGTQLSLKQWNVRQDGAFTKRPSVEELRGWIDEIEQQQIGDARQEASLKRAAGLINRAAVGVHWTRLEAKHRDRLFIALLYHVGAIAPNGTVRPVDEWLPSEMGELA